MQLAIEIKIVFVALILFINISLLHAVLITFEWGG